MDDDAVASIRERLTALQDELMDIAGTGEASSATVELDQSRVGRLSRMDALQAQAMAKASVQRRAAALREIAAALTRIDSGDYGLCENCEEPIASGRLSVDPTARLCIDCASRAEQD